MEGLCRADYTVQIGAFKDQFNATKTVEALERSGFAVMEPAATPTAEGLIRILTGRYATVAEAESARQKLAQKGFRGFVRAISEPESSSKVESQQSTATIQLALARQPEPRRARLSSVNYLAVPDPLESPAISEPTPQPTLPFSFNGYIQSEGAYTFSSPSHWSKFRNVLELAVQKKLTNEINLKISGRFWYDGIYDLTSFFPDRVKRNEQFEAMFRETYVDVGAGDWDFRVGRQHIIWGEVVSLFFADVVSAKDLRELIIPDLDYLRIPQWAARAEYFKNDFHAEAVVIPYMTYDQIGKPGSDFYPFLPPAVPGFATNIRNERMPHQGFSDAAAGLRLGYLLKGWDLTGFYYDSINSAPAFFRQTINAPTPTLSYTPDHRRIHQLGGTVSKDFQSFVLRGEAVYTWDSLFSVSRLSDADGVVRQDFLDYIIGLDFPLPADSRLNFQFFQRRFPNHDPDITPARVESGVSLFASTKMLDDKVEPDLLVMQSLNRLDWMVRPRVTWQFHPSWRLRVGTALFGGTGQNLFGRFANRDRVFAELRYAF